ncbi:ParH-like protein [Streptomyces sp. NPDC059070]|uniref:ParH-like protein n=1 Tax=Streptomyces sp. NPDC059070 TaxID=3346713 RepID=UPI00367DF778
MRNRCRRIAGELRLPEPFSVVRLVAAVAEQRGRPLELLALPSLERVPCGVLVATDSRDYIGYPAATTVLHKQHIVLHEIGHLICGHLDTSAEAPALSAALAPHLSPELVRRVLGRSHYSDEQEREAELVASLIALRASAAGQDAQQAEGGQEPEAHHDPGLAAVAALIDPARPADRS